MKLGLNLGFLTSANTDPIPLAVEAERPTTERSSESLLKAAQASAALRQPGFDIAPTAGVALGEDLPACFRSLKPHLAHYEVAFLERLVNISQVTR